MSAIAKAKRLSELLRVIILQLGNDVARSRAEFEQYSEWAGFPAEKRLAGKNQAQLIDLYKSFRSEAGLCYERDVYLQQEQGDADVPRLPSLPYAVLAHNLRSAFNVGSVFRSTDCFGLECVHLSGYTPSTNHVTLKSAARGAEDWIPHRHWNSPLECIEWHQQNGYAIIALETGDDCTSISQVKWPEKGLILLGNEELGIAPELLKKASLKVTIPMVGRKASMNVAGAFAIMAFCIRNHHTPS
jgi:tRNA G18 (ribose-2'-O)-methylase SpoU